MVLATSPLALSTSQSPWRMAGDILIEAAGKAASGAVMTDVFLLPFGDGGREGLGRERLPRWTALITLF